MKRKRCLSKIEKKLEKLNFKKSSECNMIFYYEKELKLMDTKLKRDSFSSNESHERYKKNLERELKKHQYKFDCINKEIHSLEEKLNNVTVS